MKKSQTNPQKKYRRSGFDRETGECYMDVADVSVWADPYFQLILNTKKYNTNGGAKEEGQLGPLQLRFFESGAESLLVVYQGDKSLVYMQGPDLIAFLRRAAARTASHSFLMAAFADDFKRQENGESQ
ncbi:MAG TPA: hypothetical protein VMU80_16115 [Bryobacteraceae bacterium]|nr:hypothetical protein [Bryobacteraceae bacterium]